MNATFKLFDKESDGFSLFLNATVCLHEFPYIQLKLP